MSKEKTNRENKGITLIALIITIIVMLILVGVTVTVALNGGLFTTAKRATSQTEIELEKERLLELALGALNDKGQVDYEEKLDPAIVADGTFQGTNGTYTSKKTGNKYTVSSRGSVALDETIPGAWEQNGDEIKFVAEDGTIITTLKIGDKVNYDETDGIPLSYETDSTKGTYASKNKDKGTYTIDGANDTIATGNLEWRVLGLNDEGQIELISATPTTAELALMGNDGYANAVTDEEGNLGTLDTFCNNLYGKGNGALKARSLNVEDAFKIFNIEKILETNTYLVCWIDAMIDYTCGGPGYCISLASNNPSVSSLDDWWTYYGGTPILVDGTSVSRDNPGPFEVDLISGYFTYISSFDKYNFLTYEGKPVEGWGGPYVECYSSWLANYYNISGDASNGYAFNIAHFVHDTPNSACISGNINISNRLRPVVVLNSAVQFTPVDENADGEPEYFNIK